LEKEDEDIKIKMTNGWKAIKFCWVDVYVPEKIVFKKFTFICRSKSKCYLN